MMARWLRTILATALSGCVCATRPDATADAGRDEASPTDLQFVGTVVRLGLRKEFDPTYKWVVVMRVERVVEGAYDGDKFAFVVHSPSQQGLREGARYEIHAVRTSGTAYRFEDANPLP
jgi:hypothetical protein